ncbi:MAG TPA: branched-chain amino acid ABC transporter permease [Acidimicrobiales bacterium]|nr:branched-chain amino acid ABC transporter permease [Acidimicrobiales bacterium]
MDRLIVSLVSGLSTGGIFALISLGLVVAFRSTQTMNFAHGQFMLLGALIVAKLQLDDTMPLFLSIPLSLIIVAGLAAVFYLVVLNRIIGLPHFISVIATLGLAALLDGIISLIFGTSPYQLDLDWMPSGTTEIAGARVPLGSATVAIFSFVLAVLIAIAIRRTKFGAELRAAGHDAVLASQTGIRVHHMYVGAWAAAGALAAVAGIVFGSINAVNVSVVELSLLAFPVILLGGLDSIEGAVVGGMVIGIMQALVTTYVGGQFVTVMTYVVLLLVLLLLPQGLFGSREVTRL